MNHFSLATINTTIRDDISTFELACHTCKESMVTIGRSSKTGETINECSNGHILKGIPGFFPRVRNSRLEEKQEICGHEYTVLKCMSCPDGIMLHDPIISTAEIDSLSDLMGHDYDPSVRGLTSYHCHAHVCSSCSAIENISSIYPILELGDTVTYQDPNTGLEIQIPIKNPDTLVFASSPEICRSCKLGFMQPTEDEAGHIIQQCDGCLHETFKPSTRVAIENY